MAGIAHHKLGWSIALFLVGLTALGLVPSFPDLPYFFDQGMQRVLLSLVILGFVALLGGAASLAPSGACLRSALRLGRYPLIVSAAFCAIELASIAILVGEEGPGTLSPSWATDLMGVAFLCLFVGVFEEGLFRTLLFGGLLSRHGQTRNGVLACALVSSVVFGMAHVSSSAGSLDPLTLAQMLLKTAQTGCLGLLFAAVYVRTHSFWGVVALHALTDFLVMAPLAMLGGAEEALGSYVLDDASGYLVLLVIVLVVFYVIAVALFLPAAVRGWNLLEWARVPEAGPLCPGWHPREDAGEKSAGEKDAARPVRPAGL